MITRVAGVIEAEIDGDRVLLEPKSLRYFGLERVGARIWDLLGNDGLTEDDLVRRLLAEFEVSEGTCRADVRDFLAAAAKVDVIQL